MSNTVVQSHGDFIILNEVTNEPKWQPQMLVYRTPSGGLALGISSDNHGSKTIVLDAEHVTILVDFITRKDES